MEKRRTILLIEDDYLDVESVRRALKKLKGEFNLVVAHSGVDGLSLLTEEHDGEKLLPDIILLDINMPKMNGIEFLRIIKNYSGLRNIKTFILTTSADDYDKIATESLGVNGYILKPLNFADKVSNQALKLLEDLLK
jgi:CheY-like chemotaxis protein